MESITIGIPDLEGLGYTKETIRVEYKWKPPRCSTCNIFGHTGETCLKKVPKASNVGPNGNTGTRGETNPKAGPSKNLNDDAPLITKGANARQQDTGKKKISNIASPNPFAALRVDDEDEEEVVNENNLSVCAILESHVDVAAVYDTCKKVCSRWKWTSNGSLCSKGSQIIIGWNDDLVDVMIMAQTNHVMHV
ncbi:hypothetical protein Tco_1178102 [Tanacetum coccineum]